MGDVIPFDAASPKELVKGISEEELKNSESLVVLRVSKDGEFYISFSTMTPERMYFMAGVLERYALSLF